MNDISPEVEIKKILKVLVSYQIELRIKYRDIDKFYSLIRNDSSMRAIANLTPTYFRFHYDSIYRDIFIVLCKLFDADRKRKTSIYKLINKLDNHKGRFGFKGVPLTQSDIKLFNNELSRIKPIISNIFEQRNNVIAHDDENYVLWKKNKIDDDYPVELNHIGEVIHTTHRIIHSIFYSIENKPPLLDNPRLKGIEDILLLLKHREYLISDKDIRKRLGDDLKFPREI